MGWMEDLRFDFEVVLIGDDDTDNDNIMIGRFPAEPRTILASCSLNGMGCTIADRNSEQVPT